MIDASSMTVLRTVDTGQINLYGGMSQSGQYLCINSAGDYYNQMASTVILDCDAVLNGEPDDDCFVVLDYASTDNCTAMDGSFYAIGSQYSYLTGAYVYNYVTIDPETVMESSGNAGVTATLPGTVMSDIKQMSMPYSIYVNPYTGYIYATDAAGYVEGGTLYQWTPGGVLLGKYSVYINPAHFLALNPNSEDDSLVNISNISSDDADVRWYDLQGIEVGTPEKGSHGIYIRVVNGKAQKVVL